MVKTKTERILNGESDKFSVKDILIEHIRTSQDFRKDVREKLDCGTGKIARNWMAIKLVMSAIGFLYLYIIINQFI